MRILLHPGNRSRSPFLQAGWGLLMVIGISCQEKHTTRPAADSGPDRLFQLLDSQQTHVTFRNELIEDENTNALVYEYAYNGGGVAVGDVNGDGLEDLYFTANEGSNKLYLNKGGFQFADVTDAAGVSCPENWKTGVTMADVNGDGKLDLYVCRSGNVPAKGRENQLFINYGNDSEGVPQFREQAARYGLADAAFSTQAAFFDYDRDGDLDMVLVNHSPRRFDNLDEVHVQRLMSTRDSLTGVKLYRNEQGHFRNVTATAGIFNARLTYGLGVSVADVNSDGWPDLYLSNDYLSPDYLYLNNGDGTFTNQINEALGHTSEFSMGNDVADVNNDGRPDIYTVDMLPEDNRRQKLLFASDNYELFEMRRRGGLHKQYMRNMLHLNNGTDRNGRLSFSEVGQLAGVSNTDWSWAPLFADYDNDGWKDLFITNGYVHDYTNMDFLKYMGEYLRDNQGRVQRKNLLDLVRQMPSSNVVNYIFRNDGGVTFSKANTNWGITVPSNSTGAAYADLDNDGDLDLVVNNINERAFLYRNHSDRLSRNRGLAIRLEGEKQNRFGVGAKVYLYCGGKVQMQEQLLSRGYQSSVSPVLLFGIGTLKEADSLHVVWNSGKEQWLSHVSTAQPVTLREADACQAARKSLKRTLPVFLGIPSPVAARHPENEVNDFKRQPLLPNTLSYSGPCLVKGDVNGDGLEDLFIGGAAGYAGKVFLQRASGTFKEIAQPALAADYLTEDTDAVFFDAEGDQDLDLYVCSGGYDHFLPDDSLLQDRLYLNDGKGGFRKSREALPKMFTSTSCVRAADVNGDGFADLFVGGRVVPGRYPEAPRSYVLMNDGHGKFSDQTDGLSPALVKVGMITDAAWADFNGDEVPDLITAGEWLSLQVWINQGGKLTDKTEAYFPEKDWGWWNRLLVTDLNGDGKADILAGNMGLNTQCKVSEHEPAQLYYKDFDDNGSIDPILCSYNQGKSYPNASRDELLDQMSTMRVRFTNYKSYANAQLPDVFTPQELQGAQVLRATTLRTKCYLSTPNSKYQEEKLPLEVQYAPVYAMEVLDYNGDGQKDIVLGGNVQHTRIRSGNYDASCGILLQGHAQGHFSYVPQTQAGLWTKGDIRSFCTFGSTLLVGVNGQPVQAYKPVSK